MDEKTIKNEAYETMRKALEKKNKRCLYTCLEQSNNEQR